jgi:Ca2+-transporting ATPase
MLFLTIVIIQWFNAFNAKNESISIFKTKIFNNKALLIGIGLAVLGQVLVISIPAIREVFRLVEISSVDWLRAILSASLIIVVIEIQKYFFRTISKRSAK